VQFISLFYVRLMNALCVVKLYLHSFMIMCIHVDSVDEDVVNQIVAEQCEEDQLKQSKDPAQGRKGPRP